MVVAALLSGTRGSDMDQTSITLEEAVAGRRQ